VLVGACWCLLLLDAVDIIVLPLCNRTRSLHASVLLRLSVPISLESDCAACSAASITEGRERRHVRFFLAHPPLDLAPTSLIRVYLVVCTRQAPRAWQLIAVAQPARSLHASAVTHSPNPQPPLPPQPPARESTDLSWGALADRTSKHLLLTEIARGLWLCMESLFQPKVCSVLCPGVAVRCFV
jgi:hypothetical protein